MPRTSQHFILVHWTLMEARIDEICVRQEILDKRGQTVRQKMFAPWCFPARFSQTSSAEPGCGDGHTMLLCPPASPQRAASQLHNTQQLIMELKDPRPQLPVPKCCPLLSTHTVTGSGHTARGHKQPVRGPERARRYTGRRGGVTHMKAHAHTHTLNLHEDEHTPPY